MYILLGIIIILAVLFYFLMIKYGSLSFWKKASKNPELVYNELLKDEAWVIVDGSAKIDRNKLDGPFFHYVPSMDKVIKIYGLVGKYEDSQKRIEKML